MGFFFHVLRALNVGTGKFHGEKPLMLNINGKICDTLGMSIISSRTPWLMDER